MREVALENLKKVSGGGRPTGSKNKKTIVKEKAWESAEQEILGDILDVIRAQKYVAQGISVMMVPIFRTEKGKKIQTGKFKEETNPNRIVELLSDPDNNNEEDYYFIHAKEPNVKALEDVISRVFGRSRDKDSESQDPFQLAFRNLFLNFTQNNPTVLVNEDNDFADPTKKSEPSPTKPDDPKPIGEDGPDTNNLLERIDRAISKPNVEAESSVLD